MSCKIIRERDAPHSQPLTWLRLTPGQPAEAGGYAAREAAAGKPAPEPQGVEQRMEDARRAGYSEGEAAGRSRSQADVRPLVDRLARTIEELAAIKPRLRGEAESDVVRLAVAIARRVLRRELTVDPSAIEGLVKAALEQLDTREITRVRVHPDHEAALRRCLEKVVVDRTIELAADGTLERGAVLFETARGNLDASVETQLREIERGLADRFTAT
jgi:flagellar assembly protein FliH